MPADRNVSFAELVDAVRLLPRLEERPLFIAIDGFGGAGKSSIAQRLTTELRDAVIVPLDDFVVRDRMYEPSWERGWDRSRLVRDVLKPLADRQHTVSYRRFDWDENTLAESIAVPARKWVVVEGLTSLHPELADRFDFSVWVGTPIEVATTRGRARDAGTENEAMWNLWSANDLAYLAKHRPDLRADAIIANV